MTVIKSLCVDQRAKFNKIDNIVVFYLRVWVIQVLCVMVQLQTYYSSVHTAGNQHKPVTRRIQNYTENAGRLHSAVMSMPVI